MFVDAGLRDMLRASRGQHLVHGRTIDDLRAEVAARAHSSPPGPDIDRVLDTTVRGRDGLIPVRVYEPRDAAGIVIAFHGGGWVSGGLDQFDATARHLASASGQAVVSVDYRLAPESPFPAAFEDACDVLAFFDGPNDIWPGMPRPLAVFGESAGANLAAAAALAADDLDIHHLVHQVLVYPVLDVTASGGSIDRYGTNFLLTKEDLATFTSAYVGNTGTDGFDWRLSPLHATVDARTAPALIVSAALDPVSDQAERYAEKLSAAGVVVTHVTYQGVPHLFFGMRGLTPASATAQDHVARVLRRALTAAAATGSAHAAWED